MAFSPYENDLQEKRSRVCMIKNKLTFQETRLPTTLKKKGADSTLFS